MGNATRRVPGVAVVFGTGVIRVGRLVVSSPVFPKTSPPGPLSKDGEGVFNPHRWFAPSADGTGTPKETKSGTRMTGSVSLLNTPSPGRRGGGG